MVQPMTRVGHTRYESDPIGFATPGQTPNEGNTYTEWICRHEQALEPSVTWKAGESVTLDFVWGVNHVGFCDGMISYDWDKPRTEMRWFKIANFLECGSSPTLTLTVPDFLSSGRAVFRWSWTALHLYPSTEVFSQCADIMIDGVNTVDPNIKTFGIINPQLYPRTGRQEDAIQGATYADPYNGDVRDRVVGPACALNYQGNDCALTAPGTSGHINPSGETISTSSPTSTSSEASTAASTSTTSSVQTTTSKLIDSTATEGSSEEVRLCYFTNWARYRSGLVNTGKDIFEMDFDATLCTHVNYGFGTIDKTTYGLKAFDPNADHPSGDVAQTTLCPSQCVPGYKHDWTQSGQNPCNWPCNPDRKMRGFEGLNVWAKKKNPALKSLLSVGGWNFNDCAFTQQSGQGRDSCEIFSTIAASEDLSRKHAIEVIDFLRNWGFDGYDIDWEYPVVAGHNDLNMQATPHDFENYIRLLEIIRSEFEAEAARTNRPRLLLTAAVGVGKSTVEQAYDIPKMSQSLDLIGLMTYDLHGGWEQITGFHTALYATDADVAQYEYPVSVSWAADYWVEHGASPSQLLLGVASYGRGWQLASTNCNGALCAASGKSKAGVSTKESGFLSYYEIEDMLTRGVATRHFDNERKVPYIVTDDGQWIAYEDEESMKLKMDFLKSKGFRGSMIWAIDLDDLNTFPLMKTIKAELSGHTSGPLPTTTQSSTSTSASSTSSTESTTSTTTTTSSTTTQSSISTSASSTASSTSSTESTTSSPTTESTACLSGEYISINDAIDDKQCNWLCQKDETLCFESGQCRCKGAATEDSSSVKAGIAFASIMLLALL